MVAPLDKSKYYNLPDTLDRGELLRKLTEEHDFVLDPPRIKKEEFLDTFDRRLYNQNLVLVKESGCYYLKNLKEGNTVALLPDGSKIDAKFWWEFPKCELRKELKPRIDIRALLSLAKIERSIATLRLLNKDKKTILFVYIKDLRVLSVKEGNPTVVVQIKSVRGYEEEANLFVIYLNSLGLKLSHGDFLSATGPSSGKYPLDYSSKMNVHLKQDMKSALAVKLIFRNLLEAMKANELGIKEDIDTEFLHDFRVSVRRTRSALTQVKGVFPQDVTDKFIEEFSKIGKATNSLRDLDVYLLTEGTYKEMLPEDLRPGLDPLFDSLTGERGKAKTQCDGFLESDTYKKIVSTWEEFLKSPEQSPKDAENSEAPIIELAKKHIWKKYSKVIKLGSKIHINSPDPELHRLRIECKKLRYLLEFFTSLFPEEEIKLIIRYLKKLQDNLGDFNDLFVQQERLKNFLKQADVGYDLGKKNTQAAAGGLISVLYQKQMSVRKKFSNNFKEFSDKELSLLFEKLFFES